MPLPADFTQEVLSVVRQIPRGRVATYGQIARLGGMPGYARHVGRVLAASGGEAPCHRVVDASGRTAPGWPGQRPLLEAEGVRFRQNGCVELRTASWELPD